MPERVAIVGSREGADLDDVKGFVRALHEKHPGSILVSGGASGVDQTAEQEWLLLGGQVESYRPVKLGDERYGIEKWELGGERPRMYPMANEPTFENYKSACFWRDHLIAEEADRIVAFVAAGGSRGADFTYEWGIESQEKPRYRYEARA